MITLAGLFALLAEAALRGTLILAAALAATRLPRRRRPPPGVGRRARGDAGAAAGFARAPRLARAPRPHAVARIRRCARGRARRGTVALRDRSIRGRRTDALRRGIVRIERESRIGRESGLGSE